MNFAEYNTRPSSSVDDFLGTEEKYLSVDEFLEEKKDTTHSIDDFLEEETPSVDDFLEEDYIQNDSANKISPDEFLGESKIQSPVQEKTIDSFLNETQQKISEELSKPAIDRVTDVINDPSLTKKEKVTKIVNDTVGELVNEEQKSILSAWLWDSSKNIMWAVAWAVAIYLALTVAYLAFVGGSWWSLLEILKYFFGNEAAPIVWETLKSLGISIPSQLGMTGLMSFLKKNPKYKKILEQKIPDWYITRVLKTTGVLSDKTKLEDVGITVANTAMQFSRIALTGGSFSSLFVSMGISTSFKAGKQGISSAKSYLMQNISSSEVKSLPSDKLMAKEMVERSERVKIRTAEVVLNGDENLADSIADIVTEENSILEKTIESVPNVVVPQTKRKRRILDPISDVVETKESQTPKKKTVRKRRALDPLEEANIPPPSTETSRTFTQVLTENKMTVMATTAAIALVTVALTGDAEQLKELLTDQIQNLAGSEGVARMGDLVLAGFDMAKESELAKTTLFNVLIEKVGIGSIIDNFSEYLTPSQRTELRNLAQALKIEKDKTLVRKYLDKFYGILTGGYISSDQLKKLSRRQLRDIYKNLNPSDKKAATYDENTLRLAIYSHQINRIQRINSMVAMATRQGMKTVASGVASRAVTLTAQQISMKIDAMNADIKNFEEIMMQKKAQADILAKEAAEKRSQELAAEAAKLKDEAERARILSEAEEVRKKLTEDILKREQVEQARREKEIEEFKEKFKKERAEEKARRVERHRKAVEKVNKKILARDLAEKEFMEEMSRIVDVVVVDSNGEAHPLASEDLIIPEELREATDWYITPMMAQMASVTATAASSYIPLVGWVNAGLQTANKILGASETVKDINKIQDLLTRIDKGESLEGFKGMYEELDKLHKIRAPTLGDIVDDIITIEGKTKVQDIVIRAMKDKILEGWDMDRTKYEIGKNIISAFAVGDAEVKVNLPGIDFMQNLGSSIFSKITGE